MTAEERKVIRHRLQVLMTALRAERNSGSLNEVLEVSRLQGHIAALEWVLREFREENTR